MTRVISIAWNIDGETWGRFEPQLGSLARHIDITLAVPREVKLDWIKTTEIPTHVGRWWKYEDMLDYVFEVCQQLPDFDILYIRNGGPRRQLVDCLVKEMSRVKCLMKIGGDSVGVRRYYRKFDPKELIKQDAVDFVTLNDVDALVPLSTTHRDIFRKRVHDPSRVKEPIPISVDSKLFKIQDMPDEKIIGYGGRIAPEKNLQLMHQIIRELPEQKFMIAGALVQHEWTGWTFPRNCHYSGILEYSSMPEFQREIAAGMLTSYSEGISNWLLECYASGRPVFATQTSHPPELPIIGWELPANAELWKKTISEVTLDEIAEKGAEAREFIENKWLSWDEFGSRMAEQLKICSELP